MFKDHPLVVTEPGIRFYAGIPLMTADGYALGSLCVVDTIPKKISPENLSALEKLAQQVVALLELRKTGFLLRGSRERVEELDQFFSMSADAFATVDLNGTFRMVNPALCKILGYSESEMVLENFTKFIHRDDQASSEKEFNLIQSGQNVQNHENRYISKSGEIVHLSWKVLPNLERGIAYAVGRDITQIKLSEKLIEEQRAQMLAASKLASLGEMAGGVAHEINTPLNAILFCAEQIQETARELESESLIEMGTLVSETAQRISKIVKGLRVFARDGAQEIPETIDLHHVVDQALSLGSERIRQSGVRLEFENLTKPLIVDCRSVQLGQVILNLLNNAFDAVVGTRDAWIKLRLVDLKNTVRIEVLDSGAGLSKEVQDRLFQPFFTTKGVGKGTGIGLSISRGIVESHSGRIYVDDSCENTKFVVELPAVAESHVA